MNQNSKAVRFAGLSIAAGMLVGSSALNASAAPLAGVTGYTSSDATTVADNTLSTFRCQPDALQHRCYIGSNS